MQLENAYSPFRCFSPLLYYQYLWLGKAANPPDISVVGVCDFTKFRIPPPLSFELKTMSRIFPCPGGQKPIHPLVFPDIFPWLARDPTPGASRWHVHYRHRLEILKQVMFCQQFSKILQNKVIWDMLHLKTLVNDVNFLLHGKMLENDA